MFNFWKPYPKNKPNKRGWYQCSILYKYDEENYGAYVMDLFWDEKSEKWKDNRRINVFQMYDVYGWGKDLIDNPIKDRIYYDNLCERTDVVAFKKLPNIYKPLFNIRKKDR